MLTLTRGHSRRESSRLQSSLAYNGKITFDNIRNEVIREKTKLITIAQMFIPRQYNTLHLTCTLHICTLCTLTYMYV